MVASRPACLVARRACVLASSLRAEQWSCLRPWDDPALAWDSLWRFFQAAVLRTGSSRHNCLSLRTAAVCRPGGLAVSMPPSARPPEAEWHVAGSTPVRPHPRTLDAIEVGSANRIKSRIGGYAKETPIHMLQIRTLPVRREPLHGSNYRIFIHWKRGLVDMRSHSQIICALKPVGIIFVDCGSQSVRLTKSP
jgi:hypothetical protein